MAVGSISGYSRKGINGIVQNLDRRDFTANTKNTQLRLALGRLGLTIGQYRKNESRDSGNTEDSDLPATKPNWYRRADAHHMVAGGRC